MIEKTICEIEEKIGSTESVTPERKAELLKLLGTLKTEVSELAKTHGEQAISIAGFAKLSAHEAMRTHQNPELRNLSAQGLRTSANGFEQTHPRLVQIVGAVSRALSNLGI